MARAALIWAALGLVLTIPVAVAAMSPLLEWRSPVYIAAGFAGVIAMGLLLVQPLLAAGYLPGLPTRPGRRLHRWVGSGLVAAIAIHIGGLAIFSPPDVVDALTFTAPTLFSHFGVVAMWALIGAATLALLRRPARLRPKLWRIGHSALAATVVVTSVAHALLIEGTMGTATKALLCLLALAATAKAMYDLRAWALLARRRAGAHSNAE